MEKESQPFVRWIHGFYDFAGSYLLVFDHILDNGLKVWVAGDAAAIEWQYLVLQIRRLCIIVDDRRSRRR